MSQVVEARLEETEWHGQLDSAQDFVVNCVGAASRTLDGYRQSYVEGQDSIGRWLSGGKVGSLLFTSSISVYPQSEGRSVDEKSSTEGASERGRLLLEAEEKCLAPSVGVDRSHVLRLAGLYGPGRHLMVEKLKAGQPFEGNANRTLNLIHVADAADAILHCLEAGPGSRGEFSTPRTAVIFQEKKLCPGWPANLAWKRLLFRKMTKAERPTARSP